MKKHKILIGLASTIFAGFLAFWTVLTIKGLQGETDSAELFSALYGTMALFGGLVGLKVSRRFGGFKSLIGRSVVFISLGLLAQEVGQITYSLYTHLFHKEIPYPSLGDIGFFGSVILYILAAFCLIKALSVKGVMKSHINKLWAIAVPGALLSISYYFFLKGHEYDTSNLVSVLLDFGYPLGQAFYISLAVLAFILSKRFLGGVMKPVILFFLFALLLQYIADFTFLYQVSRETWQTAGINELMYLVAYFVMTLSLIKFETALNHQQLDAPAPVPPAENVS